MVLLVAAFLLGINFFTDWMWFKDLGYTSVFWKKLVKEVEIGIAAAVELSPAARLFLSCLKESPHLV